MACALFPLSLIFRVLAAWRRAAYRSGFLKRNWLPVPVVVVGNITVGGTGKTPLVIELACALAQLGKRPGIISRGYRRKGDGVVEVTSASLADAVGDEPLLMARRSGCPVFVARDRSAAARTLLAVHPEINLILVDDGLQHYALGRELEIAVFDERGVMNGWSLPAGPLREPVTRLAQVDAVVFNSAAATCPRSGIPGTQSAPLPTFERPVFSMRLRSEFFYRLDDHGQKCKAADLFGRLHAVAGIAAPERFFAALKAMGLRFIEHPFADHHDYGPEDLAYSGDAILTTEKDAVKLAQLTLKLPVWVLPVTAEVSPDLAAFVLEKLDGRPTA